MCSPRGQQRANPRVASFLVAASTMGLVKQCLETEQFGASTKIETSWGFRGSVPVGRKKNQTGGGRNELGQ